MPVTIGGSGPITGVTSINTSVSDTELGYLDGVSSALQTQINAKANDSSQGLYLITSQSFTSSSSISVNNCFTSTYRTYLVSFEAQHSSTTDNIQMRLRLSGTDNSANYAWIYTNNDNALTTGRSTGQTYAAIGKIGNGQRDFFFIEIVNPAVATNTAWRVRNYSSLNGGFISDFGGNHAAGTAYDGFTVYPSTGSLTGTLRVYGMKD